MRNLIPQYIYNKYQNKEERGEFPAVTMFVDMSGFTPMTEKLMREGREGAEVLSMILDAVFTPLIISVYKRGGFISGFAGDAFTAIYPNVEEPFNALFSANEIRNHLIQNNMQKTKFGDFDISVKIGLSYGNVKWGLIGDETQKTYYFKGDPIDACASSEQLCDKMEIIFDGKVYKFLYKKELKNDKGKKHYFKLRKLNKEEKQTDNSINMSNLDVDFLSLFMTEKIIDYKVKGEFRDVVSVFISFKEPKSKTELNKFIVNIFHELKTFGGYFARLDYGDKGSNILIFFGAPVSYEDNIERAVGFISSLRKDYKSIFRAGITSGIAYSGFVGSDVRCEFTCLGDVVNLSARFMMKAEFGEIWVSQEIHDKIYNLYELEGTAPQKFKGKSKLIKVYKLFGKKNNLTGKLFEGRLVGRKKEYDMLYSLCKPLLSKKNCGVIYLYGEPGIGKSRLAYEVCTRLSAYTNAFYMQIDSILKNSMNPFIYFFNSYFKQGEVMLEEEKKQNFDAVYDKFLEILKNIPDSDIEFNRRRDTLYNELLRTKSILAALVGVRWEGSLYEELDAQSKYENTRFAIKDFFRAQSLIKPVILVIEDLQWIDADSKKILDFLPRNMDNYPITIIITGRFTDEGEKFKLDLDNEIIKNEVTIGQFTNDDIYEFSKEQVGGDIDPKLFNYIMLRSEGNPFYIEQFCHFLKENNIIEKENGKYKLLKAKVEIPKGIRSILIARVDRLTKELKELVQLASVLGREFDVQVLNEIVDEIKKSIEINSTTLKDQDIRYLLLGGEKERIWNAISEIKYLFRHKLLQNAVYEMQLKSRIKILHKISAGCIEKIYTNDRNFYSDIAFHYENAAIVDKAENYLEKASRYAMENYQNEQALDLYERLLQYVSDREKEIKIRTYKGDIYKLIGEWNKAEDIYRKNIVMANTIEDQKLVADNQNKLGALLQTKGMYSQALTLLESSHEIYEKLGDNEGIAKVLGDIGIVYHRQGKYDEAMKCYKQELDIAEVLNDKNMICSAKGNMGIVYKDTGDYNESMSCYQEQLYIAQEINDKLSISRAYANIGVLYFLMRNHDKALEFYQKQLQLSYQLGNKLHISNTSGNIGIIYYQQGNYDKAIDYYRRQQELSKELGNKAGSAIALTNISLVYFDQGKFNEALESVKSCLKTFENIEHKQGIILNSEHIGNIYMKLQEYEQAMKSFDRAIELSETLKAKYFISSSKYGKAELLYHMKDYDSAKKLNGEVLEVAESIKRHDIIFKSRLLKAKLELTSDNIKGVEDLQKMLEDFEEEKEIAEINYELFKATQKSEYRDKSLELYKKLYSEEPDYNYKEKIEDMKSLNPI